MAVQLCWPVGPLSFPWTLPASAARSPLETGRCPRRWVERWAGKAPAPPRGCLGHRSKREARARPRRGTDRRDHRSGPPGGVRAYARLRADCRQHQPRHRVHHREPGAEHHFRHRGRWCSHRGGGARTGRACSPRGSRCSRGGRRPPDRFRFAHLDNPAARAAERAPGARRGAGRDGAFRALARGIGRDHRGRQQDARGVRAADSALRARRRDLRHPAVAPQVHRSGPRAAGFQPGGKRRLPGVPAGRERISEQSARPAYRGGADPFSRHHRRCRGARGDGRGPGLAAPASVASGAAFPARDRAAGARARGRGRRHPGGSGRGTGSGDRACQFTRRHRRDRALQLRLADVLPALRGARGTRGDDRVPAAFRACRGNVCHAGLRRGCRSACRGGRRAACGNRFRPGSVGGEVEPQASRGRPYRSRQRRSRQRRTR